MTQITSIEAFLVIAIPLVLAVISYWLGVTTGKSVAKSDAMLEMMELEIYGCVTCNDSWGDRAHQCPQCHGAGNVYVNTGRSEK